MKQLNKLNKTYFNFIVFFIVIAIHFPIYHQHVDDHHPEPLKHTDNIEPHSPNDYSVNSHETILEPDVFTEESHDTHYHSHFEKDFYRTRRIDTNKFKTISVYTIDTFNNLPTHSLTLKKHSYDYYKPKYYSNNYAKTSSGLSPPRFSI
jgi:hypothetical protein